MFSVLKVELTAPFLTRADFIDFFRFRSVSIWFPPRHLQFP